MPFLVGLLYVALYIAVIVLLVWGVLWIVEGIGGVAIPANIKRLIWIIAAILCLIVVVEYAPLPPLPYPRRY